MTERLVNVEVPPLILRDANRYIGEGDEIALSMLHYEIDKLLEQLHDGGILDMDFDTIHVRFTESDALREDRAERFIHVVEIFRDENNEIVIDAEEEIYTLTIDGAKYYN